MSFLDQLPQLTVAELAPAAEPAPVEEIEEKVMAAFKEQPVEEPAAEPVHEPAVPEDPYPEGDPFARTEDLDATRRINLDDLKFGRNYTGE